MEYDTIYCMKCVLTIYGSDHVHMYVYLYIKYMQFCITLQSYSGVDLRVEEASLSKPL